MKTIALRFGDTFAPPQGTVATHQKIIDEKEYVWYGKLGSIVSKKVQQEILSNERPAVLLIHSGSTGRYWAFVDTIQNERPDLEHIPGYYNDRIDKFNTWFKLTKIINAEKDVMAQCKVISSGSLLSHASKHSMSPYFIIEYNGNF